MSKIRGYVLDADTEDILPGVAIYTLNSAGGTSALLTQTDDEGDYEFESPSFGTQVQFSFPGYEAQSVDPAYIGSGGKILLTPGANNTLEEVVIKSKPKTEIKKPNYVLPIALGSAAVVLFGIWLHKMYA